MHLNNVSVRQLNEMCWFDEKDEVCFMLKSQIQGWTNQSAQFKVEANRSFCNFCVGWESTSRILFSFDLEHYKPVLERYVNSCYWYSLLEWLFLYRRVSLDSSDVGPWTATESDQLLRSKSRTENFDKNRINEYFKGMANENGHISSSYESTVCYIGFLAKNNSIWSI